MTPRRISLCVMTGCPQYAEILVHTKVRCRPSNNPEKCPLTNALLQGDLGDDAEASTFGHTVGHVEVEALGDDDLTLGLLVLSAAVVLLPTADSLHPDVGVAVAALGLADVSKHQVSLHPFGDRDDPRDGGVILHSFWPARRSQRDGCVPLWRYSEYISF